MVKLNYDNKYEKHLVDYAREKYIEFSDYDVQLCTDPKNPSVSGARRIVTVKAIFSDAQMLLITNNIALFNTDQKLSDTARIYAITNEDYPNTAEFRVKVEKIGRNELRIVGSSVNAITATVSVLLSMK